MKKIKLFAKFLISSKSNKDRLLLSKEIAANVFVSWFGIIAEKMDVSPKAYAGIRRLLHLRLYTQCVEGPILSKSTWKIVHLSFCAKLTIFTGKVTNILRGFAKIKFSDRNCSFNIVCVHRTRGGSVGVREPFCSTTTRRWSSTKQSHNVLSVKILRSSPNLGIFLEFDKDSSYPFRYPKHQVLNW